MAGLELGVAADLLARRLAVVGVAPTFGGDMAAAPFETGVVLGAVSARRFSMAMGLEVRCGCG